MSDQTFQPPSRDSLAYLKHHQICERLETMVRHVLLSRPEDPVLAMCNHLKDVNRLGATVRYANSAAPARSHSSVAAARMPPATSTVNAAHHTPTTTSQSGSPTVPPGNVALRHHPHPDGRRGSAGLGVGSRVGSAGIQYRIERDDSARSDISAFSVTSVDMTEFLADFKAAHFSLFGDDHPEITVDDLAEVVDRVALPLPDTRLLSDLFHEMASSDVSGRVQFSAFLARMCFRIAGKFHLDVIRATFYWLARQCLSDEQELEALEKRLGSIEDLSSLVDEEAAIRAVGASSHGVSTVPSPVSLTTKAAIHAVDHKAAKATAAPAAAESEGCTSIAVAVPLLLEATLKGIGLRLSIRDAEDTLAKVGVPVHDGSIVLHLLDLSRFLCMATAQATTKAGWTIHPVSSVGADLNELSVSERE